MATLHRLATGGRATVLLCLPPGAEPFDPDPDATHARDVGLLAAPQGASAEDVADDLARLGEHSVGVVGWSTGGLAALALAANRPSLVNRLALVATPAPLLTPSSLDVDPARVTAKTLLVYGGRDPNAASAHGRWWQSHLPHARLEMTPDGGDRLIAERWARTLAHLSPRTPR